MLNKLFVLLLAIVALILADGARAQTPSAPSNCTLAVSPTSLPYQGGNVTFTAACQSGGALFNLTSNLGSSSSNTAFPNTTIFMGPRSISSGYSETWTGNACDSSGINCVPFQNSVTVTVAVPPPTKCTIAVLSPNPLPAGGGNVALNAACSGGNPSGYTWTGPGVTGQTTSAVSTNITSTSAFTVTASNASGQAGTTVVVVVLLPQPAPVPPTILLPPGQIGFPYSVNVNGVTPCIQSSDGTGTYAWGTSAVPGLNLGPTGIISGTPTQPPGTNVISAQVSGPGCASTLIRYQLVVTDPFPPPPAPTGCTVTANGVNPLNLSAPASVLLVAVCSGGGAPSGYKWTPNVLPSTAASGTVQVNTTQTISVQPFNATFGNIASVTITVPGPTVTLNPGTLPAGKVNIPYTATLTASGGTAPYTFAVSSGPLPTGLALNPQTGVISGTPTTAGPYAFTITATDSAQPANQGSQSYTISIGSPPAGNIKYVSGDGQAVPPSTAATQNLVAQVINGQGNPVSGVAVTWSQPPGQGGVPSSTAQLSDANGFVQISYTTGPGQQDNKVTVTANETGSTFTFTIRSQQTSVTIPAKQVITPQAAVAVGAPTAQLNNVRQRLDQLRMASSPTVTQGLRVSFDGRALPPMSALALAPTGKDGKPQIGAGDGKDSRPQTGGGAAADKPDPFERWGVFINGDINVGRQSPVDTQTGFKVDSTGVTVGTDYRFAGSGILGASVGFVKADTDLDAGAGNQNAKGYSFSLYGSYVPTENAYIDGILNLGHNRYDGQRQTPTASFDSNTSGNQWGLAVSAGYAFNRGQLALTPYGRVEYVDAKVNGFTESGDATQALNIGEQRIKATTLTLGGTASYAISTSWGVLLPNGRLEFQYLAQSNANDVTVHIASGAPTQLQVLGPDKSFGNFSVGLTALFGRGVSAFFNYQQLFGKSNVTDQLYTLGLRVDF